MRRPAARWASSASARSPPKRSPPSLGARLSLAKTGRTWLSAALSGLSPDLKNGGKRVSNSLPKPARSSACEGALLHRPRRFLERLARRRLEHAERHILRRALPLHVVDGDDVAALAVRGGGDLIRPVVVIRVT